MVLCLAALAGSLSFWPGRALAAAPADVSQAEDPGTQVPAAGAERPGSALATAAAVFPGLLLPGVGHLVLGQGEDVKRFLVLDAVGLALIGLGFGGQAVSGGVPFL